MRTSLLVGKCLKMEEQRDSPSASNLCNSIECAHCPRRQQRKNGEEKKRFFAQIVL